MLKRYRKGILFVMRLLRKMHSARLDAQDSFSGARVFGMCRTVPEVSRRVVLAPGGRDTRTFAA